MSVPQPHRDLTTLELACPGPCATVWSPPSEGSQPRGGLPLLAAPAARLGQAVIEGHGAWFLKLAGVTPEAFHDLVYRNVSVTSLRNAFVEGFGMFDGLRDAPVRTDLRVDCWYGEKEKGAPAGVRALRQRFPRFPRVTERVFPGYGHGEILQHPDEFVDALVSFLEGDEAQESE